jgi:hypothetical protein
VKLSLQKRENQNFPLSKLRFSKQKATPIFSC